MGPIPWEQRNDFGNEVIRQHTEAINEAVRLFVNEEGVPQLEAKVAEKFNDPTTLLRIGLGEDLYKEAVSEPLYFNQIVALLIAICEVNEFTQLLPLIDPNSTTPTALSGILSDLMSGTTTTEKIESGDDSFSQEFPAPSSESSPIPS